MKAISIARNRAGLHSGAMRARIVEGTQGVALALAQLRAGAVVGMPTETVYGLAADATNLEALAKIFEAKGRPATNPLILHVLDSEMAARFAKHWDERAQRLARAFWPGPLTLVVQRAETVLDRVTAGGETVALRAPKHPDARSLIAGLGRPVAAPSANRSTGISPTTAAAVLEELGDRIDLVLDGGACEVGLESTVLDLTEEPALILRPGHITAAELEAVLGTPVRLRPQGEQTEAIARSPGQMRRHYAPKTPLRITEAALVSSSEVSDCVFLVHSAELPRAARAMRMPTNPADYARDLYAALRWADGQEARELVVEAPPTSIEWAAVWDRLRRASSRD